MACERSCSTGAVRAAWIPPPGLLGASRAVGKESAGGGGLPERPRPACRSPAWKRDGAAPFPLRHTHTHTRYRC